MVGKPAALLGVASAQDPEREVESAELLAGHHYPAGFLY